MVILVTGGVGYIRSHTYVELLTAGYDVVVVGNLYNSSEKTLERVKKITGRKAKLYETDPLNRSTFEEVFDKGKIDSVIHFAGPKVVGESVRKPLEYYHNSITGILILCGGMRGYGAKNIVFNSSATMCGDLAGVPITESCPRREITNPCRRTRGMLGQILTDLHTTDSEWNVVLLRYFNPTGVHESELTGEDPKGIPNNLVPCTAQMAVGKLGHLNVFGDNYGAPDGAGVRDYIHVVGLAKGRVKVIQKLWDKEGISIYNLGTGVGHSVLDVLHVYEKACGRTLKYEIQPRRKGDVAACYSDSAKAKRELDRAAEKGIEEMYADSWKQQSMNPNGYRD